MSNFKTFTIQSEDGGDQLEAFINTKNKPVILIKSENDDIYFKLVTMTKEDIQELISELQKINELI